MGDQDCKWYEVGCWLDWLSDELKALVLWAYDAILQSLVELIDLIPVPDFLADMETITIPGTVAWAVEPLQLEFGISVCVSAYIARFAVRRIPVIG